MLLSIVIMTLLRTYNGSRTTTRNKPFLRIGLFRGMLRLHLVLFLAKEDFGRIAQPEVLSNNDPNTIFNLDVAKLISFAANANVAGDGDEGDIVIH
jgi:hypothetical protein